MNQGGAASLCLRRSGGDMKCGLWVKAAILSLGLFGCWQPAAAAEELRLRRVLLSTGGVGYFEYEAKVQGDVELSLGVRRDEVDDVLKSVVVYDTRGNLGAITLPGKDMIREL